MTVLAALGLGLDLAYPDAADRSSGSAWMGVSGIEVFGPAYLDRVLRVSEPLLDPALGQAPLDQTVDAECWFGECANVRLMDGEGRLFEFEPPAGWPGPVGSIRLVRPIREGLPDHYRRSLIGVGWSDELGGMGAGYAKALEGTLCSAIGGESDAMSREITEKLGQQGITHRAIRISAHSADWTLLITSGEFGDKLPIAFRGCHAALSWDSLRGNVGESCRLRVVASLPNELSARLLEAPGAALRLFAPAIRNATDREHRIGRFAGSIDILACNRAEWESIEDREEVAWTVSILIVTDGRDGSLIRYTRLCGDPGVLHVPAFPRARPPADTNRAGEAYASAFVATLIGAGWTGTLGAIEDGLVRTAATRASAAAALVLDIGTFGFATDAQIDEVIEVGKVV